MSLAVRSSAAPDSILNEENQVRTEMSLAMRNSAALESSPDEENQVLTEMSLAMRRIEETGAT